MTTQALSDRPVRGFFNGAYFLGELRRSWSSALLYFLAYFFLFTVPMVDDFASYRSSDFYDVFTTRELDYYIPVVYVLIAMFCALWAGIMACGYLNRRISAYHFGSMPIRREGMLLVKTAVAYTDFLIGLLPNIGLCMLMMALMRENAAVLLILALYCLLGFTLAYTFTLLCGMLCGTRSFHVIFTGVMAFIGPAICSAVYLIADTTCRFLDTDYVNWEGELFYYTSPFFYALRALAEDGFISAVGILVLLAISVVCILGALAFVRIRPTEAAESPMIFRPVGLVLKYLVMGLSTIFFGFFFGEIFSSDGFWIGFGMVSGAILSFMLMNVLIHRSVRRMFSGLIGLAAFAVIFSGVCWGTNAAFEYRDTHGYAREDILSVSVSNHKRMSDAFTTDDPAVIDAVVAYTDAYLAEMRVRLDESANEISPIAYIYEVAEGVTSYTYYGDEQKMAELEQWALRDAKLGLAESRTIYISQTTKWGTRTWRLYFDHVGALDELETELCRVMADSEDFKEAYIDLILSPWGNLYQTILAKEMGDSYEQGIVNSTAFIANSPTYRAIEAELREQLCYDFFQQPWVGTAGVLSPSGYWFNIPIFASQTVLLEATGDYRMPEQVIDERIDVALSNSAVNLIGVKVDPTTGEMLDSVVIAGSDPMAEIILRASYNVFNYQQSFFLTRFDRTYAFAISDNSRSIRFIRGKVPQSVIDLFK